MDPMELLIKIKGSIDQRKVHKITPICQKESQEESFLLETTDNKLYALQWKDNKLHELTSKPLTNFEKVISVTTDSGLPEVSPAGSPLILLKTSAGIEFHSLNLSNGEFKFLDVDTKFSYDRDWENQPVYGGQFYFNQTVAILTKRDNENTRIFLLKKKLGEGNPLVRESVKLEEELSYAEQIWVTKSGCSLSSQSTNQDEGTFEPDWISAKNKDQIYSYKFTAEKEVTKVASLKLPNDLIDSVDHIEFNEIENTKEGEKNENKCQDLIVFFKEQMAIIYKLVGETFEYKNYFYGDNSTLSSSCNNKKPFAVTGGPTLRQFQNKSLSDDSVRYSGELLRLPFVFNKSNSSVLLMGNDKDSDELIWYETELSKVIEIPVVEPNRTLAEGTLLPEISMLDVQKLKFDSRSTLSILDGISSKVFSDAVNLQTGGIGFDLKLVPEIGFGIRYTSQSVGFDGPPTIGQDGWSTASPNYIAVDRKSDNLDAEAKYFLILDSAVYNLERQEDTTDMEKQVYKIVNSKMTQEEIDSIVVTYEDQRVCWTVDTKTSRMTFGLDQKAVKWGWSLRNWKETEEEALVKSPTEWYLNEYTKKQNGLTNQEFTLLYEYFQVLDYTDNEDESKRKEYTKVVQLVKVQSENSNDINVSFDYDSNRKLKSYDAEVQMYKQNVQFSYDQKERLQEIKQHLQNNWESMIQFQYDGYTGRVNGVKVPLRELEVEYTTQILRLNGPEGQTLLTFNDAPGNKAFGVGHGISLSVFGTSTRLVAFNAADGSIEELGSIGKPNTEDIKEQRIVVNENCVIRHIDVASGNRVAVYCYDPANDPQWTQPKEKKVDATKVKITSDGTIVTLNKSGKVEIIKWDFETSDFKSIHEFAISSGKEPEFFEASDTIIAWYDSNVVSWIVKTINGWSDSPYTQQTEPKDDCFEMFKSKFDLGPKTEEILDPIFSSVKFQLRENVMALLSCTLDDSSWMLYTDVDLLAVDRNGKPAFYRHFQLDRDNIKNLNATEEIEEMEFHFKYVQEDDKYLIEVTDDDPKHTEQLTKDFREAQSKELQRMVLFDFMKYFGTFSSKSIYQIGNSTQITHDGTKWEVDEDFDANDKNSIKLGNQFKLKKADKESKIELIDVRNDSVIKVFTNDSNTVFPYYPGYIGSIDTQINKNNTDILYFYRDSTGQEITSTESLKKEVLLSTFSSPQFLVTNFPDNENKYNVRLTGWKDQLDVPVVGSVKIKGSNLERNVGYEYHKSKMTQSRQINFGEASIIGGGDKSKFGSLKYSFELKQQPPKAYDGQGVFIEELKPDEESNSTNTDPHERPTTRLYDKLNLRPITDLSPYEPKDCQVGYFGFEDYEKTDAGPDCIWNYPQTIVRAGISLTGSNFLRLENTEETLSIDLPLKKDQSYSISTWVRCLNKSAEVVSSILQVSIPSAQGVNWVSKILMTKGDWSYLQIKLYSHELNPFWEKFLQKSPLNDDQKIKVQVQRTSESGEVDVDHIIFAPVTWNSEIFVYFEDQIAQNILGNTGLIVYKVYDGIGDAVVKTNGLGQVNQLQFELSDTKKDNLRSLVQLESSVDPGWIQGFQHDSLLKFSSEDLEGFKAYRNGLQYSNFSKESSFSLNIDLYDSIVVRFSYSFVGEKSQDSMIKFEIMGHQFIIRSDENSLVKLISSCGEFNLFEPSGTLVFGFFAGNRTFLWGSGTCFCDAVKEPSIEIQQPVIYVKGNVFIENMIILPNPSLKITYANTIGEEIQVLSLVNGDTVKVFENNYDAMGRYQARTKDTLIEVNPTKSLMGFRSDFVKNLDVEKQQLEGEASELNPKDNGVPFTSVIYENGPLEDWTSEGRPGTEYSIFGSFATKYSKEPHIRLIKLFPPEDGYKFKVKTNRDGYSEIMIMNSKDQLAAHSAITPGSKHILATYDYDEKDRMIVSLPPQYHEQEGTIDKGKSWKSIGYSTDAHFGTFYNYDEENRMIYKSDPDTGTFEYIFNNSTKNPSHALHKGSKDATEYDSVMYFEYGVNEGALLTEIGEVSGFTSTNFTKFDLQNRPKDFPRIAIKNIKHLGSRYGPLIQTQMVITKNKGNLDFIQELDYQLPHGNLVGDSEVLPSDPGEPAVLISTRFTRSLDGEKVLKINYASDDDIALGYTYNLLGQVSEIYFAEGKLEPVTLARYEYAPNGQISKETLLEYNTGKKQLLQPIQTQIDFNSPGYAVQFSNPFFLQSIKYDDNGYGDLSTGEPGYPSSTTFQNLWAEKTAIVTPEILKAEGLRNPADEICHDALQKLGYLDDYSRILKLFRLGADMESLPVLCTDTNGRRISTAFSKVFMDKKNFGYKFQYGNHKELIKVKFFDSEKEDNTHCSSPLSNSGLSAALGISEEIGQSLWNELRDTHFILEDKEKGQSHTIQGKSWTSMLDEMKLKEDLGKSFETYGKVVAYSLGKRVGENFQFDEFSKIFDQWKIGLNSMEDAADKIYKLLEGNGYLTNDQVVQPKIFNEAFPHTFIQSLGLEVKKVFSELSAFFSCQIGENTFDFEVFDMDYNGNPKKFWNGFERREFEYVNNTNKISSLSSKNFLLNEYKDQKFSHDSYGNLNSIEEKDGSYLLKIDYDTLSSRPLKMELKDGRTLHFRYDYKGERVSKQVYGSNGKLEQEIKYFGRDSKSRVLVEQEITYLSESIPPKVTTTQFYYGPRGLFAFRRNGKFYNVLLDNIGSTRMVLRNGQVVASYNYLPYGQLASDYISSDPDADIKYRFTGQEFDSETGLYNFHFRMYDPTIGRFYQVDPEEIFYSPYKYVGNAPIIFIDPDGREPFTIFAIIVLAAVGAYLGAAAVNGSWNPAKWSWSNPMTYVGIVLGAIAGGTLISGVGGSFAVLAPVLGNIGAGAAIISLGTATMYLNVAATMDSWDPTRWDWSSPGLYNAAFQGFATGAGFVGGVNGMKDAFAELTTRVGKIVFITGSTTLGVGFLYYGASSANDNEFRFWKWDFTKPGTFNAIIVTGPSGALHAEKVFTFKKIGKNVLKEIKSGFPAMKKTIWKLLKRHGEYDLVQATVTAKVPVSAQSITQFNFDEGSVSWTYVFTSKTDFAHLTKAASLSVIDVLDALFGDVGIFGMYSNVDPWIHPPNSTLRYDQDIWLEHVAETAYARLGAAEPSFGNETMRVEAVLIKNGSVLAVSGSSGFLFDGPVILIEREFYPDVFERFERLLVLLSEPLLKSSTISAEGADDFKTTGTEPLIKDEITRPEPALSPDLNQLREEDAVLVTLVEPSLSHSEENYSDSLNEIPDTNGEKEYFGFFSLSKSLPFEKTSKVMRAGARCLASTGMEGMKRTILTEPNWEKQADPFSYSAFNYVNPGRIYTNLTEDSARNRRSVTNQSVANDFDQHSTWVSNDEHTTPPSATSSGNKVSGFINQGIKMFKGFWNGFLKSQAQSGNQANTGNSEPFEKTNTNRGFGKFQGRNGNSEWTSEWKKCVPWVLSEENGYVDGFTCFTKGGIVQVTPKLSGEIAPGAIMSTDNQDTYEDCQFMKSSRGMGSAYCKGHKSDVKYIVYIDERPFDRVNDNLLLMGLMLHFYQVWKSEDEEEMKPQLIPVEKEKLQSCKEELEGIRLAMEVLRRHTNDPFYMDWAWNIFEDRVTELETFEMAGAAAPGKMEEFEDNLSALKEEIYEGYLISSNQ